MARPPRRMGNLPAEPTSFVGRRRELAAVRRRLAEARLVTLAGPGGVGKTRLAIRMAGDLGRGFADGAWLVELAELRDPALVGNAVMAALDLRDQAAAEPSDLVVSYLRDKRLLLVVDNCEHLLPAVARLVAEVLRAAPGVRVLATSREPLSAPGEHVVPIPPLDLPPEGVPPAQARRNEAVLLFAERAAAGSGTFELTSANTAAVADLCRRLDGLPLAIELAAVRTRVLSAEQILDRLTDRFGLLTGGGRAALARHQTLRTTIDWSHDLLEPAERTLLRRLCVFAGRFTLDDVEAVCAYGDVSPAATLDLLASLVDKSLVVKEDLGGLACYRLHETMREYAGLRLRAAGEEEALGRRHAEHYLAWCARSSMAARRRLADWLGRMDLEIDNVRSVLRRCLTEGEVGRGVGLAYSLGYYWMTRALNEGTHWLDELLTHRTPEHRAPHHRPIAHGAPGHGTPDHSAPDHSAPDHSAPDHGAPGPGAFEGGGGRPRDRARGLFLRGFLAVLRSDPASAVPTLAQAVAQARESGPVPVLSQSLSLASIAASMAGDRPSAGRLADEAHAVTARLDDHPARLMFLQSRALVGLFDGDLDTVRAAASEGVRLARETGDLYSLDMMLVNLGSAHLIAGDLDGCLPLLTEALRVAYEIDDRVGQYVLLDALGCHAAASGRPRMAARLLGAAETVRTGAGASVLPYLAPLLADAEESATAALGATGYATEFAAGRRLTRDAAIALALGEPEPPAGPPDEAPLGRREAEVARLVADGLSNRQIGARLFISEHTVDSHVRGIMNKLGFNSRAQIAAWSASQTGDH